MDSNYILTNLLNVCSISIALLIEDVMPILAFISLLFAVGWNIVKLINWLKDHEKGWGLLKRNLTRKKND